MERGVESLFLPNGSVNPQVLKWRVLCVHPSWEGKQPNCKLSDPVICGRYDWRIIDQWTRKPLNYRMSKEEAARTGRLTSYRCWIKCQMDTWDNIDDHTKACK